MEAAHWPDDKRIVLRATEQMLTETDLDDTQWTALSRQHLIALAQTYGSPG